MAVEDHRREVETLKASQLDHVGVYMWRGSEAFGAVMLRVLRSHGFTDLTPTHMGFLAHVELSGSRLTGLAHSTGHTKQAVSQMVKQLEKRGYLETVPDPTDGRARIIRRTERGREMVRVARDVKLDLERMLARRVGKKKMARLKATLEEVTEVLGGG